MILKIISNVSSIEIPPFNFMQPSIDPAQHSRDLYETLMDTPYIGLTSSQVGVDVRAFVLRTVPGIVCFNPRVVDQSQELIVLDETDASFPNLSLPIKRSKRIKVRYAEPSGEIVTKVFDGITARYFLHQLDFLNGISFTERCSTFHLNRALRKQKILTRKQKKD